MPLTRAAASTFLPGIAPSPAAPKNRASSPAGSPPIALGKGVAYFDLPCRSILNRCNSERMPFEWTVNPYRGCEFGCTYCYARYTHEYMGFDDPADFERRIFVKRDAARAVPRDLRSVAIGSESIAIGTATDPYQPAERKFRVTRGILEELARGRRLKVSITTKSSLVTRDLDLLQTIAARSHLRINLSVTTLDQRLARRLEPRATSPEKRFQVIETLRKAGLEAGVFLMPVLPGLTDSEASIEAVVRRAARARAGYLLSQVLFLTSTTRRHFFPFLKREFPDRYRSYQEVYGSAMEHRESYRRRIHDLVDRLRRRYGVPGTIVEESAAAHRGDAAGEGRSAAPPPSPAAPREDGTQLSLAL
ncbi:MAG TPA: radical SAM protein [Candidatus Polarisedimenticolia bacterium]|nr:radical SAM protein [Candidatus Polarisedimenticolia bacterium]